MMKVISSQKFVDYKIVDEKIEEIKEYDFVTLPIIRAEMKDLDDNELYVLIDGHHTKEAAEELGIKIVYEEVKNEFGLVGEELLEQMWMDSDWYCVETGVSIW